MKLTVSDLDNPLIFVFNLALVLIPLFVLIVIGATKLGLFGQS